MFIGWNAHYSEDVISPKFIYRLSALPIKMVAGIFVDIDKLILKFIWKCQRTKITKTVLQKNKVRILLPPNFTSYYKASVTKTPWYRQNSR